MCPGPICVIFNPAARGHKASRFRESLATLATQCVFKPTYAPGTGRQLAAEAVREGYRTIVGAGGDGTLNEVVNGIADEKDGLRQVCFGVVPLGTVNVFAKELGLPSDMAQAWETIQKGRERLVDLPWVEFHDDGRLLRRHFIQLAGAGLDSRAIQMVDLDQKKLLGPLAYVVAGLKALAQPAPRICAQGDFARGEGELVLIGNGRYYGGQFKIFPNATLQDGRLDVAIFPRVNWEVLLRCGIGWVLDQLHARANIQLFQTESLELTSLVPMPFEVDGDNAGHLPARFGVQRSALRVLAPA